MPRATQLQALEDLVRGFLFAQQYPRIPAVSGLPAVRRWPATHGRAWCVTALVTRTCFPVAEPNGTARVGP